MSFEATNWARRCGATGMLRPAEVLLLLLMADHADEQWSCHPSREVLARDSNQSVRSITTQTKRLRELGLITVENRYGHGRGRIGVRYYLQADALKELATPRSREAAPEDIQADDDPEITRGADPAGESWRPGTTRSAESAPESQLSGTTRSADPARESFTCRTLHDSGANPSGLPLREHARINHHQNHHPGATGEAQSPNGDDDDDQGIYRGVRVARLFELVPHLTGQVRPVEVPLLVDVVIARAGQRRLVRPTAYVAHALTNDLESVLLEAGRRWEHPGSTPADVQGESAATGRVPVPCTNPDHEGSTNPLDCHQCRLEERLAPPAPTGQALNAEEINGLSGRLRERLRV